MAEALRRGYATASTDTGHTAEKGSTFLGEPVKLTDYGYRAVHEMTVAAKAIVAAFYGARPKLSYWNGCSLGGRQGLMEAQRFPEDYDGIIAGAPANPQTRLSVWNVYAGQAALKDPASAIAASKFPMIHRAVIDRCDELDGLKDGLISDPNRCSFDFKHDLQLEIATAERAAGAMQGKLDPSCVAVARLDVDRAIITGRNCFVVSALRQIIGGGQRPIHAVSALKNSWST